MASAFDDVWRAADQPDGGIEVITVPAADSTVLLREAASDASRVGFVPIMASADSTGGPLATALLHRHVLIICRDDAGRRLAIAWVRALAQASPRRHLVIIPGDAGTRHQGQETTSPGVGEFVSARLARAERWLRRGRARTAERWLVAAAEAARRRGDAVLAAHVETHVATRLLDCDRIEEADSRIRALLRQDVAWPAYAVAAGLRADVLLSRRQFVHARAWLTSISAEAQLRRETEPDSLRARVAELDFWQGRTPHMCPEEMARMHADAAGWVALSAWSRGNLPQLTLLAARLRGSGRGEDPVCRKWYALIQVLLASKVDERDVEGRIASLIAFAEGGGHVSRRFHRLCLAVAARLWLSRRRPGRSMAVLETARGPGPEGFVCDRLREQATVALTGPRGTPAARARREPPGVEFLASGSITMHLVDGLSGLLAVIEDSEDDAAVLAGGCKWVCRQAGAAAVAIVSADRTTLVAAEGWRRADLSGEIAAILAGPAHDARLPDQDATTGAFGVSVRYVGVTIGHVVARGLASDRPALQQAVQALAALSGSALRARLDAMTAAQHARGAVPEIVGDSPLIHAVRDAVSRAAAAPFPVLIEGESGTGKELVARALHRLGPRRDRRLCAVNCAALSDDLVEAELFGHTRGAFTGAVGPRAGLFEEANGGTLFLDEVTELSPRAQAKLLRVLQEREIRRVGENVPRAIDVRVIAACNVPLADAVASGRFRDDLRFRLAVVRIGLPALRDRPEDVPPLARLFWRRAAGEAGTRAMLGPDAVVRLTRHSWPGNVRELQNVLAGLVVTAPGRGRVTARHVDQVLAHVATAGDVPAVRLEAARRSFERRVIAAALVRHAGRRTAAATELGLTRQGLTKALRRLGLPPDEDAAGVA